MKLKETSKTRLEETHAEHLQSSAAKIQQLQTEVRTLKRLNDDQSSQVSSIFLSFFECFSSSQLHRQSLELRSSDERLTHHSHDAQFTELVQRSNEELEQTIDELNDRSQSLERQVMELLSRLEERNEVILSHEEQFAELQRELQAAAEKTTRLDEYQSELIEKSARLAQVTERWNTEELKNEHRMKVDEENERQIHSLQEELNDKNRQINESLLEGERNKQTLTLRIQQLTNELKIKHDECQQIEKKLHQQVRHSSRRWRRQISLSLSLSLSFVVDDQTGPSDPF